MGLGDLIWFHGERDSISVGFSGNGFLKMSSRLPQAAAMTQFSQVLCWMMMMMLVRGEITTNIYTDGEREREMHGIGVDFVEKVKGSCYLLGMLFLAWNKDMDGYGPMDPSIRLTVLIECRL